MTEADAADKALVVQVDTLTAILAFGCAVFVADVGLVEFCAFGVGNYRFAGKVTRVFQCWAGGVVVATDLGNIVDFDGGAKALIASSGVVEAGS